MFHDVKKLINRFLSIYWEYDYVEEKMNNDIKKEKIKEKWSIASHTLLDSWHMRFFAHTINVVVHYNNETQLSKHKHVLEKFKRLYIFNLINFTINWNIFNIIARIILRWKCLIY